jgi:hypothetical protein
MGVGHIEQNTIEKCSEKLTRLLQYLTTPYLQSFFAMRIYSTVELYFRWFNGVLCDSGLYRTYNKVAV